MVSVVKNVRGRKRLGFFGRRKANWQLYLMMLLPFVHLLIFNYGPMYGAQIAFRNFNPLLGFWDSPWVGLAHFRRFMDSHMFRRVLTNTLRISVYGLVAGFPMPIILAFSLNYIKNKKYAKFIQTTTFLPSLISVVVFVGIINQFLNTRDGVLNNLIYYMLGTRINFLGSASNFTHMFVWTGIWASIGSGAIIYIAALAGVDPSLHEAAIIDGATKLQRIRHIDFPSILPTVTILFILSTGGIISVGFERVFLLQNNLNLSASEVIATYVYQIGLVAPIPQWSFAAAIGFFQSVVNFIMLVIVNQIAKKLNGSGLW